MPTPQLSKRPVTPAKIANVTKTDIELYERLGDEAREYARKGKAKRKQQDDLKELLIAWVTAKHEGKERTVTRSGYRLSIVTVKKGVQWAKEFVKAMGEAAAEKLRSSADEQDKLTVEKI